MALLGLRDDYVPQGIVLAGALAPGSVPAALNSPVALRLARLYKQLEAPVGEFGLETLKASTGALAAGDPGDAIYGQCTADLRALGSARDAVAADIQRALLAAQRSGQPIGPAAGAALASAAQHVLQRAISTEEFCS